MVTGDKDMNFKNEKGSILIFVLVGLLFMTAFLIISYASNANKSKIIKEQVNIISEIYSYKDGDNNSYDRAYTALREKNKQIMYASSEGTENTQIIELTKTFEEDIKNYKIYGNSVQEETPSEESPVEIQGVGDLVTTLINIQDLLSASSGKIQTSTFNNLLELTLEPNTTYMLRVDENMPGSTTGSTDLNRSLYFNGTSSKNAVFSDHPAIATTDGEGKIKIGLMSERTNAKPILEGKTKISLTKQRKINIDLISQLVKAPSGIINDTVVFDNLLELNLEPNTTYIMSSDVPGSETGDSDLNRSLYFNGNSSSNAVFLDHPVTVTTDEEGSIKIGLISGRTNAKPILEGTATLELIALLNTDIDNTYCIDINTSTLDLKKQENIKNINYIFLKEPLRKIGDEADYIDFKNKKVVRVVKSIDDTGTKSIEESLQIQDAVEESIELPKLLTYEDYTKIEVITKVKPSKIELDYIGYKFD